ncbi:MAG: hypothetical protein NZ518_09085, partial [Dehalococcoidia bacterium]|nr:hypothetical protein [Dehalococcoidia bacterium]
MIAADRRWFRPGMQIKRWIALLILGIAMISLGIGYILVSFYRNAPLPEIFYWLTLQFIDREIRGAIFILTGVALTIVSIVQINRSLLKPFLENAGDDSLVDIIYRERALGSGPTIVCLGGGPGLSIVMRGLKNQTANLWGITLAHGPARTKSELGLLEGHVILASTDQLVMTATLRDGARVEGEHAIMARRSGPAIERLTLCRADGGVPEANPQAIEAIAKAD